MALLAGACAGYIAASRLAPILFLPSRYVSYTVPILGAIGFPSAVSWLADRWRATRQRPWIREALIVVACGTCMLFMGGLDNAQRGYTVDASGEADLYSFLSSLPRDSVIAGWPVGVIENVPYLSERSVLVSAETHLAFHREFVEEMRKKRPGR